MKTRPKAIGTSFETEVVRAAQSRGLQARRLAEGGSGDEGDVEILYGDRRVVIECKSCINLNVTKTLAASRRKAGIAALAWRKLVRKDGMTRRVPDGESRVVIQSLGDYLDLLKDFDIAHDLLDR